MRVAWVLYGSLDQKTGGTIYDRLVVDGLRALGEEVEVVSIAPGAPDIVTAIRASRCDVVVGDELCFRELAVAFVELGREGTGDRIRRPRRLLLVHHLTGWESGVAIEEERAAIEACDVIVATSCATRQRLIAEGVCAPIEVVVPGADRLRVVTGERAHDLTYLFVGTLTSRKRVVELVRAFATGARERGRLVLVGSTTRDAAYVREAERAIVASGVRDRVTMTGEVDEHGVARALADADVLVMPSSLEGWGIAATEAIWAGVPVIAARAQGLEEALAPCPDATLFADDEPALAGALTRFARDAELRARMRDAARAGAARMPTWSSCAAQFQAALVQRG